MMITKKEENERKNVCYNYDCLAKFIARER